MQFMHSSTEGASGNVVLIGSKEANAFALEQDDSGLQTNMYISSSGEVFIPRIANDSNSSALFFNDTTGEVTYDAASVDTQFLDNWGDIALTTGNVTRTVSGSAYAVVSGSDTTSGASFGIASPSGKYGGEGIVSHLNIYYHHRGFATDVTIFDSTIRPPYGSGQGQAGSRTIATLTESGYYGFTFTTTGADGVLEMGFVGSGSALPGGGGGTPGGSDTQVQFNDGGAFAGESTFTYDKTNNTLTVQSAGTGTNRATPAVELRASDIGLTDNDVIGQIQAAHYLDDTKNAGLVFAADANWNAQGTFDSKIEFRVTSGTTEFLHTTMKSNGRMGIGVAAPTNGFLEVNGNVSGTSIYASANIVAYSDARSKTNVDTIEGALEKVNSIRGVTYNKIEDPDGIRYMGVIAQELQPVIPEVVAEGEEGNLAVAYGNITGVLIEAVKELTAKVESLEQEIKDLKGK